MKVLIYVHPLLLAIGPENNSGWLTVLLGMVQGLVQGPRPVSCMLVTGDRFMQGHQPPPSSLDGVEVKVLDEIGLHRALRVHSLTPSSQCALVYGGEAIADHLALGILADAVRAAAGREDFDVLISFGIQADFLRPMFPQALVLGVELGPFARTPYPTSFYFDHLGMFRWSVIGRHGNALRGLPPPDGDLGTFAKDVQRHGRDALARTDALASWDFRTRFSKVMLLPLQVSHYYSFDEEARYRTQFEYVLDVLLQVPKEIGVVVTEYNQHGQVLADEGPRASLAYLQAAFPNLLFNAGSRKLTSPSQSLVPRVDGIWSISSNVGLQGLLYDRVLGTNPDTYLSRIAHAHTMPGFVSRLGQPPPDCSGAVAWLLSRYYVPNTLATDGAWLHDYLLRRIEAASGPDRLAAFVPLADAGTLRQAWLGAAPEPQTAYYLAARQQSLRRELQAHQALAEASAAQLTVSQTSSAAAAAQRRYLLLNGAPAVEGRLHLGCSAVTDYIHARLTAAGLVCAATADDATEVLALQDAGRLADLDLVLLNGEDAMHSDQARAKGLLDACARFSAAGIGTALINTAWRDNPEGPASGFECFDRVTACDTESLHALRARGVDAGLIPSLAFAGFAGFAVWPSPVAGSQRPLVVIDSASGDATDALLDFAAFAKVPFYFMGTQHATRLLADPMAGHRADGEAFPRLLRSPCDLLVGRACLTGRLHGVVAALCLGLPVLALPSDKPETENLLRAAGLLDVALLPEQWIDSGQYRRQDLVNERLQRWTQEHQERAARYVAQSRHEIEVLFQDLAALAVRERPFTIPPSRFWFPSGGEDEGEAVSIDLTAAGHLVAGPYIELPAGRWAIAFRIGAVRADTCDGPCHVRYDIYNFDQQRVCAQLIVELEDRRLDFGPILKFEHDGRGTLEFRLFLVSPARVGRVEFFGAKASLLTACRGRPHWPETRVSAGLRGHSGTVH